MLSETMRVLGGVDTNVALKRAFMSVTPHVTLEHRQIDAFVLAGGAFEGLDAVMIASVILEVMSVFGYERTQLTGEQLVWVEMSSHVHPVLLLVFCFVAA